MPHFCPLLANVVLFLGNHNPRRSAPYRPPLGGCPVLAGVARAGHNWCYRLLAEIIVVSLAFSA